MKFHLAINLERMNEQTDMMAVRDHTLDMVKTADKAGFEVAWAAEHHALEMTIAPNPTRSIWRARPRWLICSQVVASIWGWGPAPISANLTAWPRA